MIMSSLLETLSSCCLDEHKSVTSSWLSLRCGVMPCRARQAMYTFWKQHQQQLDASICIAGIHKQHQAHTVMIVPVDKVEGK